MRLRQIQQTTVPQIPVRVSAMPVYQGITITGYADLAMW